MKIKTYVRSRMCYHMFDDNKVYEELKTNIEDYIIGEFMRYDFDHSILLDIKNYLYFQDAAFVDIDGNIHRGCIKIDLFLLKKDYDDVNDKYLSIYFTGCNPMDIFRSMKLILYDYRKDIKKVYKKYQNAKS